MSELSRRLADIEQYLRQAETDSVAAAYLQLEAALAHERLGQLAESEAAARAAASAFQLAGNAQLAAQAQGQIAYILQLRGQLDEALTIWQTECLPVFERLGLTRETAIANVRVMELQALVREKRS